MNNGLYTSKHAKKGIVDILKEATGREGHIDLWFIVAYMLDLWASGKYTAYDIQDYLNKHTDGCFRVDKLDD